MNDLQRAKRFEVLDSSVSHVGSRKPEDAKLLEAFEIGQLIVGHIRQIETERFELLNLSQRLQAIG